MEIAEKNICKNEIFTGYRYRIEKEEESRVRNIGYLCFDGAHFRINGDPLHRVRYERRDHRVTYAYKLGRIRRSGNLVFDESGGGFSGSMQRGGRIFTVRGAAEPIRYASRMEEGGRVVEAEPLMFGFVWSEDAVSRLMPRVLYGKEDISALTTIKRDKRTGETVVRKTATADSRYSFRLRLDADKDSFCGEICRGKNVKVRWRGEAVRKDSLRANAANAILGASSNAEIEPDMSLQDVLNIDAVRIYDDKCVDRAKELALTYFGGCMINSVEENLRNFLGIRKADLPPEAGAVKAQYSEFFNRYAILYMANVLYGDMKRGDAAYSALADRIDIDKVKDVWSEMSKQKEHKEIFDRLYVVGYRYGVPEMRPYLDKNPTVWAEKIFHTITGDRYLSMWRKQLLLPNFDKAEAKISGVFNKLMALDASEEGLRRANDAMLALSNAVLTVATFEITYDDSNESRFREALEIVGEGILTAETKEINATNVSDAIDPGGLTPSQTPLPSPGGAPTPAQNQRDFYDVFKKLTAAYGKTWVDKIVKALKSTQKAVASASGELEPLITRAVQETGSKPSEWAEKIRGAGKMLCFALAVTLVITAFCMDSKAMTISQKCDCAVASIKFFSLGGVKVLDKLYIAYGAKVPTAVLRNLGKWANGAYKPSTWVKSLFGANGKVFIAFRLAPVLLLASLVVSCVDLAKNWKNYDTFERVAEISNIVLSGAEVVFMLIATCCPFCGVIATALGIATILILLIEAIYQYCKPPKPPVNAATIFVNETLKKEGYLRA